LEGLQELHLGDYDEETVDFLEKEIVRLNHSDEYIGKVKQLCAGLSQNETHPDKAQDVYYSNGSYDAALLVLLAVVKGIQTVLDDKNPL